VKCKRNVRLRKQSYISSYIWEKRRGTFFQNVRWNVRFTGLINDGLPRRWLAEDKDAPRSEVVDHSELTMWCGVCMRLRRLVGGEIHEIMKHMKKAEPWRIYSVRSMQLTGMWRQCACSQHKTEDWIWGSQEAAAADRGSIMITLKFEYSSYRLCQPPQLPGNPRSSLQFCAGYKHIAFTFQSAAWIAQNRSSMALLFSYVSLSHEFLLQPAAADACRPHIT